MTYPTPATARAIFSPSQQPLNALEARVLATLMEKARTVPDTYPMTVLGITTGCNQKSSRDPVMNISESDTQTALSSLQERALVSSHHSGRTARWEHHFQKGIGVPEQSAVLLGLLILRGPQTAAELRLNAERWYRFADTSSVEAFLQELQDRSTDKGGALTVLLPKAPGARESRWAHLLCGAINLTAGETTTPSTAAAPDAALQQRIDRLEDQVAHLQATVQRLCDELGITAAPPAPEDDAPETRPS